MRLYLKCIVKDARTGQQHKELVAFLSRSPNDNAIQSLAGRLATPGCLEAAATMKSYVAQLSFNPVLMRGEAFRALYLQRMNTPTRLSVQPDEIENSWVDRENDRATPMRQFGDCVVAIDPTQADLVVRAGIATEGQTSALRVLMPAMSKCLANGTVHFSRATLEGVLAESLYRREMGAVVPAKQEEAK